MSPIQFPFRPNSDSTHPDKVSALEQVVSGRQVTVYGFGETHVDGGCDLKRPFTVLYRFVII